MWLYIPAECLASAPESADSISASHWRSRLLEQSATWRTTPMPARSWLRAWRKRPWMTRLFGLISEPSTAARGVEWWIASLRGFPASRSPSPASAGESPMSDGSGPTLPGLFARWSRDSCSWKTFRGLFDTDSPTFSATWPSSGSLRSGACYQRPPLAPRTSASGFGFWPTPDAGVRTGHNTSPGPAGARPLLGEIARHWPTPAAADGAKGGSNQSFGAGGVPLVAQAATFPSSRPAETTSPDGPTTSPSSPMLNPVFAEALIGLPIGWTACERLGTGWCHWRRRLRSAVSALA